MKVAEFEIKGSAPLVIKRMSEKYKEELRQKMITGKAASSRKNREPVDIDKVYNDSRYVNSEDWDGFHAGAIRAAMVSVCRLVGFKMTLAKLSVFILQDGWDKREPQIPLIRIYGKPIKQEDMARTSTGEPVLAIRAAYHDWSAKIKVRWDADQFTLDDVTNLMMRVGLQAGLCEGRPDSKKSTGMGWGLFDVKGAKLIE